MNEWTKFTIVLLFGFPGLLFLEWREKRRRKK